MPIQPFFFYFEAQLSLKNAWSPQFFFWISIAPDMIFLSQIVIIWEKILPISVHVLNWSVLNSLKCIWHEIISNWFWFLDNL